MLIVYIGLIMNSEEFFKKYDRKFIQINRNTAILIHVFEKDKNHSWEDLWLHDFVGVYEKDFALHKESAKQFIDQLEGHWCLAFIEALRDECNKHIKKHEENCLKYENCNNQ